MAIKCYATVKVLEQSRDGYTTNIHLASADEDTVIAVELTSGQASDAPQFPQLFQAPERRVPKTDDVAADKGGRNPSHSPVGAQHPGSDPESEMLTATEPWPVLAKSYRQQNRVERLLNKLKQFRGIATRYDKLAASFLASIKTVLTFIKLRRSVNITLLLFITV